MKVILLKDVQKQGKKEQIIEVSDGYAHNYLIKNNLAVIANESNVSKLKKTLENRKANEKELILEMKELKNKLEKDVKILLQIHDELLLEVREDLVERVAEDLKDIMESVLERRLENKEWQNIMLEDTAVKEVSLKVDSEIGDNLFEVK